MPHSARSAVSPMSCVPHPTRKLPDSDERTGIALTGRAITGQATLHTRRLILVPLAEEHLEHEVELDSDPEVMRYLGNGTARDRAHVERFHGYRLAAAELVPGLGFWAGCMNEQFVGWWILEPPTRPDQGPVEG